ncbi:MAG TPA: hypothetical protein VL262_16440 [Vicinamibacterales bacterium]|jgi:hypothetical protein|nr:hypothetical protein [Vicinamibacterales bacterium]
MRKALLTIVACGAAMTTAFAQQQSAAQLANNAPETFTAFAVNMNTQASGAATSQVDIHVQRYSTDKERDDLMKAFKSGGQDALLDELQKLPVVGYIRTPSSLRYDLHFARQIPNPEGGRKIILLTDRHMAMWEVVNSTRSTNYPFTLVQLQIGPDGKGVGKASIATKITQGGMDNVIELENFENQPVLLNNVQKARK